MTEGTGNRHPGQGTENRRFFFGNAFIELLWIADIAEIQSKQTHPTMLFEHLSASDANASQFGICFRPSEGEAVPFPSWEYTPPYLPAGMKIDIAGDTPLSEPMWFFLAGAAAPASYQGERQQPLQHRLGVREISALKLSVPGVGELSRAAMVAGKSGQISFKRADDHLLEIVFDGHRQCRRHDFRPALPLIIHY